MGVGVWVWVWVVWEWVLGGGAAWGPSWFPCRPLKFSYAPMHTIILLVYHFVPLRTTSSVCNLLMH